MRKIAPILMLAACASTGKKPANSTSSTPVAETRHTVDDDTASITAQCTDGDYEIRENEKKETSLVLYPGHLTQVDGLELAGVKFEEGSRLQLNLNNAMLPGLSFQFCKFTAYVGKTPVGMDMTCLRKEPLYKLASNPENAAIRATTDAYGITVMGREGIFFHDEKGRALTLPALKNAVCFFMPRDENAPAPTTPAPKTSIPSLIASAPSSPEI